MTMDDLKSHSIKVYSTPWCGDCKKLKSTFKSAGLAFEDVNIEADAAVAADLEKRTGHKAIPYVEVDGKALVKGWHKDAPGRWDESIFLAAVAAGLQSA